MSSKNNKTLWFICTKSRLKIKGLKMNKVEEII